MVTSVNGCTELAQRTSGGIDVHLFWDEPTNRITVGLVDARTDERLEFEIDEQHALDAFNHPYAYAGRRGATTERGALHGLAASPDPGSNSQQPTINPQRSDHAPTDR